MATAPKEAEITTALGKDALLFRRMQGVEELGRLPEYQVELLRLQKDKAVLAKELLGTKATVKILLPEKKFRYVNAWVAGVELGGGCRCARAVSLPRGVSSNSARWRWPSSNQPRSSNERRSVRSAPGATRSTS